MQGSQSLFVPRKFAGIDRVAPGLCHVDTDKVVDRLPIKGVVRRGNPIAHEWLVLRNIIRATMLAKPSSVRIVPIIHSQGSSNVLAYTRHRPVKSPGSGKTPDWGSTVPMAAGDWKSPVD